jgi:hypothetical protein
MTMKSSLPLLAAIRSVPLYAPRFIDDSFKKTPHSRGIKRAVRRALDVQEDLLLALGGVDGHFQNAFDLADLDRVFRSLVEEAHDDLVDAVDGVAKAGKLLFCVRSIHKKKPLAAREEVRIDSAVSTPS